ncbi:complement C2 [Silurus asotus]|uniref:C3/C5 convertase n=1 Tax=Silurus asotus TaxID=30991 RepID=A0AAD5AZ27_SILAS|nr:complement C2 [Silurus asotus]
MHFTTACLLSLAFFISIGKVHLEDEYDYDYDYDDQKCSMTESIIGGTVEYSKEGKRGSEVTYHCKDGFKPYPIYKKTCSSKGKWEPEISRVICDEELDYGVSVETQKNCSVANVINEGSVSYSNEGLEGSVLTYHCKVGYYPHPVSKRVCNSDGEWSIMALPSGKIVSTATCKEILCPGQLQLYNGQFWPRKQRFKIGEVQEFSCREGLTLSGSAKRNCTEWGHWTGTPPVCIDQNDGCKDPGTPPGAIRSGDRFHIGDKVKYRCMSGMDLLGSEVRACLDSKEWSGPEPRCHAPYMFDLPASVAQAMAGSLSGVMDVSSPEFKKKKTPEFGRSIKIENGQFNIFILIDTSGSIQQSEFENAKAATANLIRKLSSYDVTMKFDIISYASEPQHIVKVSDFISGNTDQVLEKLSKFDQTKHGKKTGTNLYKALKSVEERLANLKASNIDEFTKTQNVIIIETDGYSNMGGNPQYVLGLIRNHLGYSISIDNSKEELLDVYVFGIGANVKIQELKSLASNKIRERHLFILKNYKDLGDVFNRMINDSAVTKCGVAQEVVYKTDDDDEPPEDAYSRPWHVSVSWQGMPCQGSLLNENWVITAAHCLMKLNYGLAKATDVRITHGEGTVYGSLLISHPNFNVTKLKEKKIDEFYDYDVALIKLNSSIKLTYKARPICLPCTKPSNHALKMHNKTTCKEHESTLLDSQQTKAYFIRQGNTRMQTHIQTGEKRVDCIEQFRPELPLNNEVSLTDVVTDRFLCTGGSQKYKDHITCKGDSGGSLFLRKGLRYFQVGIVSWGNKVVCDSTNPADFDDPPENARDFHISVFSIMPWLMEHLGNEIEFLPLEN